MAGQSPISLYGLYTAQVRNTPGAIKRWRPKTRKFEQFATRLVVGSTTVSRIRVSRFDDENGACRCFEPRSHRNYSAQVTPRSITISIRSVVSSPVKSKSKDARLR
jgi:hypothetical protein